MKKAMISIGVFCSRRSTACACCLRSSGPVSRLRPRLCVFRCRHTDSSGLCPLMPLTTQLQGRVALCGQEVQDSLVDVGGALHH
jgi:hypothetical protein